MQALDAARELPAVQSAVSLASGLIPGLDLSAPVAAFSEHAPALAALVRLLGGLMAVETVSSQLADTAGLVGGMLDAEAAAAALRRLDAFRDARLGAALAAVDPDDEAAVLEALRPIAEFSASVRDTAALLVRGLAFGQATLVDADVAALGARLDAASATLTEALLAPVRDGVSALTARLAPLLAIDFGAPAASVEAALAELTGFVGTLTDTIEGFDAQTLTRPVTSALDASLEPLRRFEALAHQVIAAIQGAFQTIRQALAAIDLRSVATTIQTALRPVVDALGALERLIGDAQAAIETAARAITTAMNGVKTTLGGAATTVTAAFGHVQEIVEGLHLADLQRELEQGIGAVVAELQRAQLKPYFDAGIEVMDTAAGIVAAVPVDLLPDDTKQEIHEAVAPIKAIDFQHAVRDVLVPRMREILDAVDDDVLAAVDEAYHAVLAFLNQINPRAPLQRLESEVFDPMLTRVRAVDPLAVLEPVQSVLDEIQSAIAGINLRRDGRSTRSTMPSTTSRTRSGASIPRATSRRSRSASTPSANRGPRDRARHAARPPRRRRRLRGPHPRADGLPAARLAARRGLRRHPPAPRPPGGGHERARHVARRPAGRHGHRVAHRCVHRRARVARGHRRRHGGPTAVAECRGHARGGRRRRAPLDLQSFVARAQPVYRDIADAVAALGPRASRAATRRPCSPAPRRWRSSAPRSPTSTATPPSSTRPPRCYAGSRAPGAASSP